MDEHLTIIKDFHRINDSTFGKICMHFKIAGIALLFFNILYLKSTVIIFIFTDIFCVKKEKLNGYPLDVKTKQT